MRWLFVSAADEDSMSESLEERAREAMRERGRAIANQSLAGIGEDVESTVQWLAALLAKVQADTAETIAQFAETHYCVMDFEHPGQYKVCERPKHPCEPLAKAIRGEFAARCLQTD